MPSQEQKLWIFVDKIFMEDEFEEGKEGIRD